MMRVLLAPSERAASTNSFSRSESVVERTMRAMYGQLNEITKMTSDRPGCTTPSRHPVAVCPHEAAMPIREQQLRQREHDVGDRITIVSTNPR